MSIARVVVDLSLDREFDYRIPPALLGRVRVGARVVVPFGRWGQTRPGYVVGLADSSEFPDLKEILQLRGDTELIPENLIRLARWIADYYCCTREQAVRALLPAAVRSGRVQRRQQRFVMLAPDLSLADVLGALEKRAPKQAAALRALARLRSCPAATLERESGADPAAVRRLQARGWVLIETRVVERDPFADDVILPTVPHCLNPHQQAAVDRISASLARGQPEVILVHGVTGSGKTEVYLQAIQRCLALDRQAIVLVPEIALTPQTTERFRSRFERDVCVLHSGLGEGERFDEWQKAREGRARIVIGARSALFAPCQRLGLIVVDEEHENTYKQDEAPRYHARDTAVVRAHLEKATVVLGSATPSLESFSNCVSGKYTLVTLPERVDGARLPHLEVVDMRAEAALQGRAQVFSRRLQQLIRDRLADGSQTMLFLNRRGYATQMLCTKCGYVATCGDCSLSVTFHRERLALACHLCGRVAPAPTICPQCRDPEIRYSGIGTEKVEAIARKLFPRAAVARMDSDTMTRRDAYAKTLRAFRAGRIQILVGTQMIAKGLDFPGVTLVGIIFADMALHLPDFRAGERTFQLLTQVSGRAGRGEKPGHVIVQTYTPYHPVLGHALEHDTNGFLLDEMAARRQLGFPPDMHMAIVHFRGADEAMTAATAERFAAKLRPLLPAGTVPGDAMPAPIAKIRGLFRYQLVLRGRRITQMASVLRRLVVEGDAASRGIDVYVDVDPQSLL